MIEGSRYDVETMLGLNLAPPNSDPIQSVSRTVTPRSNKETSTANQDGLFVTDLNSTRVPTRGGSFPERLEVDEGGGSGFSDVASNSPSSDEDLFRVIDFDGRQGL